MRWYRRFCAWYLDRIGSMSYDFSMAYDILKDEQTTKERSASILAWARKRSHRRAVVMFVIVGVFAAFQIAYIIKRFY